MFISWFLPIVTEREGEISFFTEGFSSSCSVKSAFVSQSAFFAFDYASDEDSLFSVFSAPEGSAGLSNVS